MEFTNKPSNRTQLLINLYVGNFNFTLALGRNRIINRALKEVQEPNLLHLRRLKVSLQLLCILRENIFFITNDSKKKKQDFYVNSCMYM